MGTIRTHQEKLSEGMLCISINILNLMRKMYFSGKGRQSLIIYINVMRIHKMLIYYIKLDHVLYSITQVQFVNSCIVEAFLLEQAAPVWGTTF